MSIFLRNFILSFSLAAYVLVPIAAIAGPLSPVYAAVDFSPLANNAITLIAGVLTVAVGVLTKFGVSFLASKTKMSDSAFEALLADRVSDILQRAIDYGEAWAKQEVANPNSPIKRVEFNNFIVEQMVSYAMRSMPDLIGHFKLTPDRIRELILSRLNGYMGIPEPDSGKAAPHVAYAGQEPA